MALKTGRAEAAAEVRIDEQKCTGCGLCVAVCKGAPLTLVDGRVHVDQTRLWGCIGCGQCMAYCPFGAIEVRGRDISPDDVLDLPAPEDRADYAHLLGLMRTRRSVRSFTEEEVPQELVERILEAAQTAPMGLPPSDVEVLVLRGRDRVRAFAAGVLRAMERSRFLFTRPMLWLLRPFWGKVMVEFGQSFVAPLIRTMLEGQEQGEDRLFYDAPLVLYFHGSAFGDSADPTIAATYAMLAGQALGLGACMIGSASPFVKTDKRLMAEFGIPRRNRHAVAVIFGYPRLKPHQALRRRFARVHEGPDRT